MTILDDRICSNQREVPMSERGLNILRVMSKRGIELTDPRSCLEDDGINMMEETCVEDPVSRVTRVG